MLRSPCDYSSQTRSELKRGVVVGFAHLNENALRSMKEDLGLSMTVAELCYCQKAYGIPERSAPTLDEIYFLDAIADGHHRSRDFLSVARLRLNDPKAARTYKDLLEKRNLLAGHPVASTPPLCELSEVLSRILSRSGRTMPSTGYSTVADPFEAITAAASGAIPTDSISINPSLPSVRLFGTPTLPALPEAPAHEDDAIMIVRTPKEESFDSHEDALCSALLLRLSLFSKNPYYEEVVHACRAVDNRGIAVSLVSMYDGIYAELARIPSVFDAGELYDFACAEHGALLVAIPRSEVTRFSEAASHYGLFALQIARAIRGKHITVRKEGHAPYSLPTEFLRGFARLHVPFLLEAATEGTTDSGLVHSLVRNASACDLADEGTAHASLTLPSALLCTAAGCNTYSFENGLCTALLAVFEAVLSGAKPSELSVTDVYAYPFPISSAPLEGLLEAFLGVYRVLAELAIPNRTSFLPHLVRGNTTHGMSIYCMGTSSTNAARAERFTVPGSFIYMVAPSRQENDIPDFQSVRSLLRLLSELCGNGQIHAARVGIDQPPSEVLEAMCGDCTLHVAASSIEKQLHESMKGPFIILECSSEIKGMTCIGLVRKSEETTLPADPIEASNTPSLAVLSKRRVPAPTVLLLPFSSGGNLHPLKALFESFGCTVRTAPDFTDGLSEADGAQIAVLCGRQTSGMADDLARLKTNPRAVYALRELLANDGILLAPTETSDVLSELFGAEVTIKPLRDFSGSGVYVHEGLREDLVKSAVSFFR